MMIPSEIPAIANSVVLVLQDPQGGNPDAPPVLRRGDAPPPSTMTGGETGTVQDPNAPQGNFQQACLDQLPILLGFVAIFYFLILRPQQKAEKKRKELLAAITKGDRVVTNSGIHGEITALTDETVTLRVDQTVQLTFDRAAIGRVVGRSDSGGAKA